jgi:hypothetical protein
MISEQHSGSEEEEPEEEEEEDDMVRGHIKVLYIQKYINMYVCMECYMLVQMVHIT